MEFASLGDGEEDPLTIV